MKQAILSFLLVILPILASADSVEIDRIYYNLEDETKTAEVTKMPSDYYSGDIIIPQKVAYVGVEYIVTSIGEYAFYGCSGLTSITIPPSVTVIGDAAFARCSGLISITIPNSVTSIGMCSLQYCTNLHSITIPNSVTTIGDAAFLNCSGLTNIDIPNSVAYIGYNAFVDCISLTSITIPSSVTFIGERAFSGCSGLSSIIVDNDNIKFDSHNNCNAIIETSTNSLIRGCNSTIIPDNVTSIGISAFSGCSGLTSIKIPNSVTSIGYEAFSGCSGLTSITIPQSVISIGKYAFESCGLTSIIVENGNNFYDSRNDCNAIIETSSNILIAGCKKTIIPNSVTSIGTYAFCGCSGLTSVTIPNSVTSISDWAFANCIDLNSIDIPNSVTFIGEWAFGFCSALRSIDIPGSVSKIGRWTFSDCSNLTSVTISSNITSIGKYAFLNCIGLKDVYCWAEKVPFTDNEAFYKIIYDLATLHVPAASVDSYKQMIPWSQFGNIVSLTDDDPKPTGTESLKEDILTYPVGTFSIDGKHLQKAQRGLNIIRMNDGKTIKRIVK